MKKLLLTILFFIMFIPSVFAKEDNIVNIYLFHMDSCGHCKEEIKLLNKLEKEYDNIKIYKFEISEKDNYKIYNDITRLFETDVSGTPFTVIGDKYYYGYSSEYTKKTFITSIEYFSKFGYKDIVGEYLNNNNLLEIELPSYEILDNQESFEVFKDNYANYKINIPLFNIETNDLDITNNTLLLGISNIFSISNLIIILFITAIIIKEKDINNIFILFIITIITLFISDLFITILNSNINLNIIKYILSLLLIINILNNNKYIKYIINIILIILLSINFNTNNHFIINELLYLENISKLIEIIYIILYIFIKQIDKVVLILLLMILSKKHNINNKYLNIIYTIILLMISIFTFL